MNSYFTPVFFPGLDQSSYPNIVVLGFFIAREDGLETMSHTGTLGCCMGLEFQRIVFELRSRKIAGDWKNFSFHFDAEIPNLSLNDSQAALAPMLLAFLNIRLSIAMLPQHINTALVGILDDDFYLNVDPDEKRKISVALRSQLQKVLVPKNRIKADDLFATNAIHTLFNSFF